MNGILTVNRFNGNEAWQIADGGFSISHLADCYLLNIWGKSNGKRLLPPIEEGYDAEPTFELQTCLNENELIDIHTRGIERLSNRINSRDDKEFAKLYYYGDIELFSYSIKILFSNEENYKLLASITAEDVVFTSAKPKCELKIECDMKRSENKTAYWT